MKRTIELLTAALVLFLAAAAFVLSYDALHRLAIEAGQPVTLAWLWPLSLDAMMVAASLSVLRNAMAGESARYAWALVAAFSVASIAFNVIHAGESWLARAVFALPPAVVFLSVELLSAQLWSNHRRAGASATLREIERAIARAQGELAELQEQADALQVPAVQPSQAAHGNFADFAALQRTRNGDGPMSPAEIMQTFGVSQRTAYGWLKKYAGVK